MVRGVIRQRRSLLMFGGLNYFVGESREQLWGDFVLILFMVEGGDIL